MPPQLALVSCCALLLTSIDATASAARVFAGDDESETASRERSSELGAHAVSASARLDRSEFERQFTAVEAELRRSTLEQDFDAAVQIQARSVALWTSQAGENHWRTVVERGLYWDLRTWVALSAMDRQKLREATLAENTGRRKLMLGDLDSAVSCLSEAIEELDELPGAKTTATYAGAVHVLAIAEARRGRYDQAIDRLVDAKRLFSDIFGRDQFRTGEVTVDIGRIHLQFDEVVKAKASIQEAMKILATAGAQESEPYLIAVSTLALTHFAEAQTWDTIGLPERASEARASGQALVDEVVSHLNANQLPPDPRPNVLNQFIVAGYLLKKALYEEAAMMMEGIVESSAGPDIPTSTLLMYHQTNSLVLRRLGRTIDANSSDARMSDLQGDVLRIR